MREKYAQVFLWENGPLMAKSANAGDGWNAAELRMLTHMTEGQRISYVLGTFDMQVLNGGVAQFLFNKGHLAHEVLAACDRLNLALLKALLIDVLAKSDRTSLLKAQRVGAEEAAKSSDRSISPRACDLYERERLAIASEARRLEDQYFPQHADIAESRLSEGRLRVTMCEALNAYVAAHPGEFQKLKD